MVTLDTILNQRYQLQEKLSQYAGRKTWKAIDLETSPQKEVIIKLLAINSEVTWEAIKLFEREAQVLKTLEHKNIPHYLDYFTLEKQEESDLTWLVTVQDYIPGISLKRWLDKHHKMTEKQICRIASDILEILIYLHELNPPIIHRDIKPSNLILGKDGHVYLVDFGAVQDKTRQEGVTFTIVGSNGYAPPEQLWGQAIAASDLYALGATLIQLLTGKNPSSLLHNNRLQFSHEVELSPNLIAWLDQLINPVPEKRIQSSRQAYEQLQLIIKANNNKEQKPENSLFKKLIISGILLCSTGLLYLTYQKYLIPQTVVHFLPMEVKRILRSQHKFLTYQGIMPRDLKTMERILKLYSRELNQYNIEYKKTPFTDQFIYKFHTIDRSTIITYGLPKKTNRWTPAVVGIFHFHGVEYNVNKVICITNDPVAKIEDIPLLLMTIKNQKRYFSCPKGTKKYN
ncbi:serine/threonine-protein kinase [Crocosphaera sp.]|uniref:serine/threonine protein kinase n=1 Tax=Crocosphaera sp. TaxID=2729996 RepID=UPI0026206395|nr:serine/threonine-protein kinase [Crocosphaera sp.]MDJ0582089.1 serine/threonine-protein kinase [Crocosphaera sp.]